MLSLLGPFARRAPSAANREFGTPRGESDTLRGDCDALRGDSDALPGDSDELRIDSDGLRIVRSCRATSSLVQTSGQRTKRHITTSFP